MEGTYGSDTVSLIANAIALLALAALPWFTARWTTHRGARFFSALPGVFAFTAATTVWAIDAGLSIVPRAQDMTHNYGAAIGMLVGNGILYLLIWSVVFMFIVRHGASKRSEVI
ncbi:hypothetical protein [uncultured Aliiroseovarius sp.]|uniref:hypothetical protein n=1 Tax=uncultured Aliiroseovarius sp. TaxID=1658783 RepID=UPI002597843C|nr:hypothetical protein [uncultured Aliiroseovarius sp.]